MNRVIKFRAWDGYRMILPEQIFGDVRDEHILSFNGELFFLYEESNGSWCPSTISSRRVRESTLMQYTGLTDKHGVEIYEGDVMCWPQYEGTKNQRRWVVSYDPLKGFCSWSPVDKAVVIGNIHENKDMLTV